MPMHNCFFQGGCIERIAEQSLVNRRTTGSDNYMVMVIKIFWVMMGNDDHAQKQHYTVT